MTTQSPPIVSLQAPKDVSIDVIEQELRDIWQSYNNNEDGMAATRATTFSFIVYEPDAVQELLTLLGYYTGPIDGIAGPRTHAAIKVAQKDLGLEVTGLSSDEFVAQLRAAWEAEKNAEDGANRRQYAADLDAIGVADAIAASNPCRIITLCPTAEADEGVKASVSAYCPVNKRSKNTLVCCEYVTLSGTAEALERIGGIISELTIPSLPKFLWWKASPDGEYGLFKRLASQCDTIIVDSSTFREPETELLQVGDLLATDVPLADLNWSRLAPWQELTAEAFDPPERRDAILEVDRITIDYEKGNPCQAFMFLGWMASRLQWRPVGYSHRSGDYAIHRISFLGQDQRLIEAELAGIPVADWGEIQGDLISIKLSSTNLQADCCTVICSGTTGCMRMEASGGAQSCRIEQVSHLEDQKTETLLGKQLQRWGQDVLYQESMKVTGAILKLSQPD